QASDGFRRPGYLHGAEREIAILFGDLRSFTQLSEKKLPYDLVFLLNRYFAETGHAVEATGGRIDKFIGDGVMALFGLDPGAEAAAAGRAPPRGNCRKGGRPSTARWPTTSRSRYASASASIRARRSSGKWATARRCPSPRSAMPSTRQAASKASRRPMPASW